MNRRTILAGLAALPITASAQEAAPNAVNAWREDPFQIFQASDVVLADLRWELRGLFVFGEAPNEPAFIEQMELIAARHAELVERDVIVVTDTDPGNPSALRQELRPRAFMLALVGKDGEIKLRKPAPWSVRELSRTIDKMPMRQREIDSRRGTSG